MPKRHQEPVLVFRELKPKFAVSVFTQWSVSSPASLFSDPGTSFSKPHAILYFNFFVGVKKKTFVFFLTAICGLEKNYFVCKTLHFEFCLDFLICTIFLNLLMCACLACLFLFCFLKTRPKALSCGFLLIVWKNCLIARRLLVFDFFSSL